MARPRPMLLGLVLLVPITVVTCGTSDGEPAATTAPPGAPLVADFDYTLDRTVTSPTSCPVTGIRLMDRSTGDPTSWTWTLPGGVTSTEANPTLAFSSEMAEVTLRVERDGRTDTITKPVINSLNC